MRINDRYRFTGQHAQLAVQVISMSRQKHDIMPTWLYKKEEVGEDPSTFSAWNIEAQHQHSKENFDATTPLRPEGNIKNKMKHKQARLPPSYNNNTDLPHKYKNIHKHNSRLSPTARTDEPEYSQHARCEAAGRKAPDLQQGCCWRAYCGLWCPQKRERLEAALEICYCAKKLLQQE